MESSAATVRELVATKPERRWLRPRFSLRSLMLLVAISGIGVSAWMRRAEPQRRAVAAIRAAGGRVMYDFQGPTDSPILSMLPGRDWLRRRFDVDHFSTVRTVDLFYYGADDAMQHVADLTGLRRLHLGGSPVTDAGLRRLSGLKGLRALDLSDTQITDAGLAHLSGLTNLRELRLSRTKVSDAGLAHLAGMKDLELLHLDWTRVTDAGLEHLMGLTNLQLLYLGGQVSDAGRIRLERSLPNYRNAP